MDRSMEPETLAACFDAYSAALLLYARQFCPAGDAEDVVQEAFISLARQHIAPRELAAWLFRTVRNGALSLTRTTPARSSRGTRRPG